MCICEEMIQCLYLQNVEQFFFSFDWLNIFYCIVFKEQLCKQLFGFFFEWCGDVGIVYCLLWKKVEEVVEFFGNQGFFVLLYYVGLFNELCVYYQKCFFNEEGLIMVVIIVFGMGIDKFNVCFVVYFDLFKSFEVYYQEIGCVGCDGLLVDVWMVYGLQDVLLLWQMMQSFEGDEWYKCVEWYKLEVMLVFCEEICCWCQVLLVYFDEEMLQFCGYCDNCVDGVEIWDVIEFVCQVLLVIYCSGQCYGVGYLVDILFGCEIEKICSFGYQYLVVFGIGKGCGEDEWWILFCQLVVCGLVDVDLDGFGGLCLIEVCCLLLWGEVWLELCCDFKLQCVKGFFSGGVSVVS